MIDDLTALRLQLDWGSDEALGRVPVDRLVATKAAHISPAHVVPAQVLPARPRAASAAPAPPRPATTLDELHVALDGFTACGLRATATHTVRPSGAADAAFVLIAEAPGNDDDRSGHAFSGADGAALDRVLASIGLDRTQVLLTTLVPWRPPGNRPPTPGEVAACLPFVHRLLGLVRPQAVLLAGAGPVTALTGQNGTIRQLRGRWLELPIPGEPIKLPALAVLPFALWLRDAATKQQLWSDLLLFRKTRTTT